MFQWLPYPFLRILLFFITGIVAGLYTSFAISGEAGIITVFILFALFIIAGKVKALKDPVVAGLLSFLIITLIGYIHVNNHLSPVAPSLDTRYFIATISGYPEEKENSIKYTARLNKLSSDGENWSASDSKVLLYIDKSRIFTYGDVIIVKSALSPIEGPKNPGEFNYKNYLRHQGIQAHAFISPDDLIHINHQSGSSIIKTAFKIRKWVEQAVDQRFATQEASIMKALLVGIRSDMDNQLKKNYAAAGAVHILAVSGLHVGIVYGLLLWTLGWLRNIGYGKIIFAVTALLLLWFYAFVTGFPPSILRAVLMFSFIILSQAINRGSNIYNAIAASAFFLLCFNPLLILNVGFQLSYLAVAGIIFLYPKIVWLLEFNNLILDRVWQMSVVGIAAQLATFPLVLYYFHQFPTYFWLSNLVVVPAASIILCSGLFFLSVLWWSLLSDWVAEIISWIIAFMNGAVKMIAELPGSTVNEIYLSQPQFFTLCIFLLTILILFATRNIKLIWVVVISGIFFISMKTNEAIRLSKERMIQFYSINYQTQIDFIEGNQLFSYSSDTMADNEYFVNVNREKRHATFASFPPELLAEHEGNDVLWWNGRSLLIMKNDRPQAVEGIDYLLLENNSVSNFENLLLFKGENIILGTTNNRRYCLELLKFARKKNLSVHDLNKGSLAIQL